MPAESSSAVQNYTFVARDTAGARRTGKVSARSSQAVAERLRAEGLYPIDISLGDPANSNKPLLGLLSSSRLLTGRQQADLIARLAKLTERRVPIDRALQVVADGQDGKVAEVAARVRRTLREGTPFSKALETQAEITDQATLSLVRGAEVSGDLAQALVTAAELMNQRLMLRRRIATGLTYPVLLLVVAIISLGLILVAIIPQFRPLIEDRMDLVPPLGRAIFGISSVVETLWPVILGCALIFGLALWLMIRAGKGVQVFTGLLRRLPLVGQVFNRNQVMMALETLSALLSRGVILSQALRVTVETAPETGSIKAALRDTQTRVETGERLTDALRETKLIPASTLEVVRIGEESGDLALMVGKAAEDLRETADRDLERFLALFQPALIILVGLMIGVSLYALFSAIVSVNAISL
ncbi:MAG: type II secretion system F family protein [Pseudomonadota bacterium]